MNIREREVSHLKKKSALGPFDVPQQAMARPPAMERVLGAVAGTLLARPWFDTAGLYALRHWYFPVSRLWAAARVVHGDPDRFCDAVQMYGPIANYSRLRRALKKFQSARIDVSAIEEEWEHVFFGSAVSTSDKRASVEEKRLSLCHAYNATRRHFRYLISREVPRVKLAIATPAETNAIYGTAFDNLTAFTSAPDPAPKVEVSRKFETPTGIDYWLRCDSPSQRLNDTVYARVHEPAGARNPPTIIFGHGICVEFDHWRGLIDECHSLVRLGFRVIRPEAPWHGRRVPPGNFGGERVVSTFPTGILDTVLGAVREWAVLAGWAREMSSGPLAFGGSSLGALTSQFAADRAVDWPTRLKPDALLLITHCANFTDALLTGELATLWMSPAEIQRKGWTEDLAQKYLSLLEPRRRLTVPPQRIVSVLGRRDIILPFESGRQLVEQWGVPKENLFIWDRGHFSVPMTMIQNAAPLRRLADVVAKLN